MSNLNTQSTSDSSRAHIQASAPFDANDRIIETSRHILQQLVPAYEDIHARFAAALKEEQRRYPPIPEVLFWRLGDPVGYSGEEWRDGRRRLICDFESILNERGNVPTIWHPVTDVSSEDHFVPASKGSRFVRPRPEFEHLYRAQVNHRGLARLRELAAALDHRDAQLLAISSELEIDDLDASEERALAQIANAVDQLVDLRARSLEALRAKAAVMTGWLFRFEEDDSLGGAADRLARSIVEDLQSLPS